MTNSQEMSSNHGPSFSFAQFPIAVNHNHQDAAGGAGGDGGASGHATSNPFALATGAGGHGGGAAANGGTNSAGSGLGLGEGGDGVGAGGGDDSLLSLLGLGGDGTGTGGSGLGAGLGGSATGADGGLAGAGDGGDGASAGVTSVAASGDGGDAGDGGDGGTNSADQTVNTTANLSFDGSFTDDDGFDLKGADVSRSFNQDNDGVDNSHGIINASNVADGDQTNVGNSLDVTTIDGSFNTDESVTNFLRNVGNTTDTTDTTITGSGNTDTTDTTVSFDHVGNTDQSFVFDNDGLDLDLNDILNHATAGLDIADA